jgi:hypothetical protein
MMLKEEKESLNIHEFLLTLLSHATSTEWTVRQKVHRRLQEVPQRLI